MTEEEKSEAPNWLAKLEEQREKRLRVKLGHEAGAGAPCQNCGDKCPGLDLHFWRKICKLCKCSKEEHDITDDDIYGFVQFQLLGNKPSKAMSIFLSGKVDAVTLDWTPKGSNNDVKKYLEQLPEEQLPVKGSEAARIRKQRLQKQMPAHDIDATLCHALSPEEVQQLEEYVAHIRKHSVGQGKIIQLPLLRGQPHKLSAANSQFLNEHVSGQVASSQPVYLHSSNISSNLQTKEKVPGSRTAFLHSQIPVMPGLNTVEEQQQETLSFRKPGVRIQPNYAPKHIHQITDSQEPMHLNSTTDLEYPHNQGVTNPLFDNPALLHTLEKMNLQDSVQSEKYYGQNPEFAAKLSQRLNKISSQNSSGKDKYPTEGAAHFEENKFKILNPNSQVIHSAHNVPLKTHTSELLSNKAQEQHIGPAGSNPTSPYGHSVYTNPEWNSAMVNQGNISGSGNYGTQYTHQDVNKSSNYNSQNTYPNVATAQFGKIATYGNATMPDQKLVSNNHYSDNYDKMSNIDSNNKNENFVGNRDHQGDTHGKTVTAAGYTGQNVPYNYDPKNIIDSDGYGIKKIEYPVQLPLTTSNVERHQEQFQESDVKNRLPLAVFSAESRPNPAESEQSLSSVGYIRDIEYNVTRSGAEADLLNSNLPTCHRCGRLFEDGAIAVSAERTSALWHSGCFNCRTCAQPLADLLYFYHRDSDDIYCGRDYSLLKGIPRCHACDELIFVREYCLAEERTFHVKHFCCFECDQPLAGKQYVMEMGQPTCTDCYERLKAQSCADCGYVIGPEEQGVSLQELHWHAADSCFACKHCRVPLLGRRLLLRNQNLFCSDICYKTYHAT